MPSPEDAVIAANQAFYAAFRARDLDAMGRLWAEEHVVACIHPGWHVLYGRDEVMASWQAILQNDEPLAITCAEATAFVFGTAAFVTCTENLGGAELVATNVFALENGDWKMVHHHAGPFTRRISRAEPSSLN